MMTAEAIDTIGFAAITLDGKQVKLHRASSGVFPFTGASQLRQVDGLWALIEPPSPCKHVIGLKWTHPWFGSIEGTWNLTVVK